MQQQIKYLLWLPCTVKDQAMCPPLCLFTTASVSGTAEQLLSCLKEHLCVMWLSLPTS